MSAHRLGKAVLEADLQAQDALAALPDYQPANPAFSQANVESALAEMQAARQAELRAQDELGVIRDAAAAAEWRFHEIIIGVKEQVIAQYGKSSDQLQKLGLKRKVEYRRPVKRRPPVPTTA